MKKKNVRRIEASNKAVAYYSTLLSSFVESRREKDRSIMTLSGGGIGLLITLLSTIGFSSLIQISIYLVALIAFVGTIVLVLIVFKNDAEYARHLSLKENKNENQARIECLERKLERYDKLIMFTFLIAILCSIAIAVLSATTPNTTQVHINEP